MTEHRKLRIFICHTEQDKPAVRELHEQLKRLDWIEPWLGENRLLPGQDWDLEIFKAIRAADAILVCLSNESIREEGYIQRQFKRALSFAEEKPDGTIYIIPLLMDDCTPPVQFQRWQWVNYSSDEETGRLIESLRSRANGLGIITTPTAGGQKFRLPKLSHPRPLPSERKSPGFRFIIEMMLGFMLPTFACMIIFIAAASRKYFEGMWTTGVREIVITSIIFFGLLILSSVLFVAGLGRLTTSTMNVGARIPWAGLVEAAWKALTSREEFKRQAGTFLDTSKTFWERENWVDPEFKERVKAAVKSLVMPGWGLWSRDRIILGVGFLIATTIGYFSELLPGILLHLIVIVLSGVLDAPKTDLPGESRSLNETNI